MDNFGNRSLPSYYGDLPQLGTNLANQYSEGEQQQTGSYPDVVLVLRSEANMPNNDSEQQFWADNELESESSSFIQQVSTNVEPNSNQHGSEMQSPSSHQNSTEISRRRPMTFTATVPASSGKVAPGARKSKAKRKFLRYSPTPSSSSSGDSNPSISNGNKNALGCCSPSESRHQNSSQMCWRCKAHSQNAVFIHGSIGHQCYCYHCAFKLWRAKEKCPMCNQRIKKLVKIVNPKLNNRSKAISRTNLRM